MTAPFYFGNFTEEIILIMSFNKNLIVAHFKLIYGQTIRAKINEHETNEHEANEHEANEHEANEHEANEMFLLHQKFLQKAIYIGTKSQAFKYLKYNLKFEL